MNFRTGNNLVPEINYYYFFFAILRNSTDIIYTNLLLLMKSYENALLKDSCTHQVKYELSLMH